MMRAQLAFVIIALAAGPVLADVPTVMTWSGVLSDDRDEAYALRAGAVDWSDIENVPADLLDGVDAAVVVRAGNGITVDTDNTVSIASGGVTSQELSDGSVTTAKIAADAIVTTHLTDQCIGTAELAANAVTSEKVEDGTLAAADLAPDSVTSAKIVDGSVTSAKLASGAVASANVVGNVRVFQVLNSSCTTFGALTTATTCTAAFCNVNSNGVPRFRRCGANTCDQSSALPCNIGPANSAIVESLGVLVP